MNNNKSDSINPDHYKTKHGIECIDFTESMSFCLGNAFKYVFRAGSKDNPIQDLEKALWYLKRYYGIKKYSDLIPSESLISDLEKLAVLKGELGQQKHDALCFIIECKSYQSAIHAAIYSVEKLKSDFQKQAKEESDKYFIKLGQEQDHE